MDSPTNVFKVLRSVAAVAAFLFAVGGCYRLTPIEGSTPAPGLAVRLGLSDEGSVRLAPLIGPRIGAIDGRMIEASDTAFVLAVEAVVAQTGRSMPWSQERLAVPRSAVTSVRTRTLDRKRSWIAAGVGVIGALALGEAFGLGIGVDGLLGRGGTGTKR